MLQASGQTCIPAAMPAAPAECAAAAAAVAAAAAGTLPAEVAGCRFCAAEGTAAAATTVGAAQAAGAVEQPWSRWGPEARHGMSRGSVRRAKQPASHTYEVGAPQCALRCSWAIFMREPQTVPHLRRDTADGRMHPVLFVS
eukprot:351855-Chlamydomonas_euryale.AAC.8